MGFKKDQQLYFAPNRFGFFTREIRAGTSLPKGSIVAPYGVRKGEKVVGVFDPHQSLGSGELFVPRRVLMSKRDWKYISKRSH